MVQGGQVRQSVIGIVHRMGLIGQRQEPKSPGPMRGAPSLPRPMRFTPTKVIVEPSPPKPLPKFRPIVARGVPRPWLDRKFGECAFPINGEDGEVLSCCALVDTKDDGSLSHYCLEHRKRMYAPKPAKVAA